MTPKNTRLALWLAVCMLLCVSVSQLFLSMSVRPLFFRTENEGLQHEANSVEHNRRLAVDRNEYLQEEYERLKAENQALREERERLVRNAEVEAALNYRDERVLRDLRAENKALRARLSNTEASRTVRGRGER